MIESEWVFHPARSLHYRGMKRFEIKRDRIRDHSPEWANRRIDEKMMGRLKEFARKRKNDLMKGMEKLDREWDIDKVSEFNTAILALVGTGLSFVLGKKWLGIPAVVVAFLLEQVIQGWNPLLPVFRVLGFRSAKEIDKERLEMAKLLAK